MVNSRHTKPPAESDAASQRAIGAPPPQTELPELTPLQYLVIWLLLDGRKTGRTLRRELGSRGAEMSKPAFSQMMQRLQFAGLVRGDNVSEDSPGPPRRYCVYQARVKGLRRWRAARDFYARFQEPPGAKEHLFNEAIQRREDEEFQDEFVRLGLACVQGKQVLAEQERDQGP